MNSRVSHTLAIIAGVRVSDAIYMAFGGSLPDSARDCWQQAAIMAGLAFIFGLASRK